MKKVLPFLAVAFSGFIVYLFDKIWGNSIDWDKVRSVKLREFLTKEFALYEILLFIIFAITIFIIGKKLFVKKKGFYTKQQQRLRKFNQMKISDAGILMKWDVYFDYDKPFISDLTPFCTKHEGNPIRFINNSCPIPGCENSRNNFNKVHTKNLIESDLISMWDKLK